MGHGGGGVFAIIGSACAMGRCAKVAINSDVESISASAGAGAVTEIVEGWSAGGCAGFFHTWA